MYRGNGYNVRCYFSSRAVAAGPVRRLSSSGDGYYEELAVPKNDGPTASLTGRFPSGFPRAAVLGLQIVFAILVLLAAACSAQDELLPIERRAQQLNRAIMCPVCPGESIDQSQNPLAAQMRNIVSEKLEQGWSESQIKSFFVERYGDSVLLEPRRSGFSLIAWLLPPIGVAGAGVAVVLALRIMRRPARAGDRRPPDGVQLSGKERDEYFRRIEAALDLERTTRSPADGTPEEREKRGDG